MRDVPPHLADLTDMQRALVQHVARGVGIPHAAMAAGYAHDTAGYRVLQTPHVRRALDAEFEHVRLSAGPEAWGRLQQLARSDHKETALKASIAILDCVGIGPSKSLDVHHKHSLDDLSPAEIDARINALLAKARGVDGGALIPLPAPIDAVAVEVNPASPPETDDRARITEEMTAVERAEYEREMRALGIDPETFEPLGDAGPVEGGNPMAEAENPHEDDE